MPRARFGLGDIPGTRFTISASHAAVGRFILPDPAEFPFPASFAIRFIALLSNYVADYRGGAQRENRASPSAPEAVDFMRSIRKRSHRAFALR